MIVCCHLMISMISYHQYHYLMMISNTLRVRVITKSIALYAACSRVNLNSGLTVGGAAHYGRPHFGRPHCGPGPLAHSLWGSSLWGLAWLLCIEGILGVRTSAVKSNNPTLSVWHLGGVLDPARTVRYPPVQYSTSPYGTVR